MNAESPPGPQPGLPSIAGPAKLLCYAVNEQPCQIRPARALRDWMDRFIDRHAYRCLPLNIANAHGWEVLCPVPVEVTWNGRPELPDLTVYSEKKIPDGRPLEDWVRSNFSRGIVTFHTDYIFRTPPGWDLIATGPFNDPKDGIAPLTGVIETDWLPYPFTMNWQMTRPGTVRFEQDEPFCFVFPVPKQSLIDTEPEIHRLADDEAMFQEQEAFRNARETFMKRIEAKDPEATRTPWQRFYFVGKHPDGRSVRGHINKLRLREAVDLRGPFTPRAEKRQLHDREASEAARVAAQAARAAAQQAGTAASTAPEVDAAALAALRSPGFARQSGDAPRSDPRWEAGGPLDWIWDDLTILNAAGRARLSAAGALTPTPHTRRIASAADAEGEDFLVAEDVMSEADCRAVIAAFEELRDKIVGVDTRDPLWSGRYLWGREVVAARPEAGRAMLEATHRGRALLERFYRLKAPLFNDLFQIVHWPAGMSMTPHADRADPDASANNTPYRDFGGILYLSDAFEGGELYFTALDVVLKPKRGMFVAFTGGFHHEHAVLSVGAGETRLTMPTFFTFDSRMAEPLVHPGVADAARAAAPTPG